MANTMPPFHLAIPVDNLEASRKFYRDILELTEGRSSDHWVDFDFFGHQLVIHLKEINSEEKESSNPVDGKNVPIPHFGLVLDMQTFKEFSEKLIQKNLTFIIEPYIRFKGQVGEQATMFFKDPAGNALEFKAFADMTQLFAK
ncbi:glyoxalase [Aequorivita aquimaris]|uniref:Glyoxalase n=1 Tax=Aequorivita aquimaris TaxID=1548749 RepID=A0A137RER5_9FLAO|nr:VOC family protein [Aequorivita aquimaris]KXN97962.1 glyoxalase [Aequorivita aquimaris]|tara:strand:- start:1014 stop:1442 length:429 start_codon:yes stop_codon:yes gene_type:complete